MTEKKTGEKLEDALLRVALGFQVAEVTEEFSEVDGELKLTKRKRIKKDVPPDLKAVQLLLGEAEGVLPERMSDAELEEEKRRLLELLAKEDLAKDAGQVCVEVKKEKKSKEEKTVRKTRAKPRKRVVRSK